jgi:hypothetical protein
VFGAVIPGFVYYRLSWVAVLLYEAIYVGFILFSALLAKNFRFFETHRPDFPAIHYGIGGIFLIASCLAFTFSFIAIYPVTLLGMGQFALVYGISVLALFSAVMQVAVISQRVSLRRNIGLTDNFFKENKTIWEKKLEDFPLSKDILQELNNSQYVSYLFERGSFSLVVLWSCNVMEKTIDAAAKIIMSTNQLSKPLFLDGDNKRLAYPAQLENLGFTPELNNHRANEEMSVRKLWHGLRNDIAHRNYNPTFEETSGAILVLVTFMNEFPDVLIDWKTGERKNSI